MTSLRSLYGSGDDEEEIFSLVDPEQHPRATDDEEAHQEHERLASGDYDETQEQLDEAESPGLPHDLLATLQGLTEEQLAEVSRFLVEIQDLEARE